MIVILDTSVVLSHLLSRGNNNTVQIFESAKSKKIILAICKETLNELKIKLSSPEIKKLLQYKPHLNAIFIAWYQYNAKMYSLNPANVHFNVRDPNDIIYLQLALISKANYLISGDKDLLILQKIGKTSIIKPNIFVNKFMFE